MKISVIICLIAGAANSGCKERKNTNDSSVKHEVSIEPVQPYSFAQMRDLYESYYPSGNISGQKRKPDNSPSRWFKSGQSTGEWHCEDSNGNRGHINLTPKGDSVVMIETFQSQSSTFTLKPEYIQDLLVLRTKNAAVAVFGQITAVPTIATLVAQVQIVNPAILAFCYDGPIPSANK